MWKCGENDEQMMGKRWENCEKWQVNNGKWMEYGGKIMRKW
jgi:hypothetical protein